MPHEAGLWFASRWADLPQALHMGREDGDGLHAGRTAILHPGVWKVKAGDRLALIGERPYLNNGMFHGMIEFQKSALVYWLRDDGTLPLPWEALSAVPSEGGETAKMGEAGVG